MGDLCSVKDCSNPIAVRVKLRAATRDKRKRPVDISEKLYVHFGVCEYCQKQLSNGVNELEIWVRAGSKDLNATIV